MEKLFPSEEFYALVGMRVPYWLLCLIAPLPRAIAGFGPAEASWSGLRASTRRAGPRGGLNRTLKGTQLVGKPCGALPVKAGKAKLEL